MNVAQQQFCSKRTSCWHVPDLCVAANDDAVLTQTDAAGNVTTFTYDPVFNKPTTVTDAEGNATQLAYDGKGNLLSITDANNRTTTFTYWGTGVRSSLSWKNK